MPIQTNPSVKLASGRTLEFQHPGLKLGNKLKCMLFQLAQKTSVGDMKIGEALKGGGLSMEKIEVNDLKNIFCALLGSEELDALLLVCMKGGSTLDGSRITDSTFENQDFMRDYIPCQMEVGQRTLSPFFVDGASLLSTLVGMMSGSPPR